MPKLIADSSVLILLAKCSLLEMVCGLFDVIVPEAVVMETASDELAKKYPDSVLISDLIAKGAISIQSIGNLDRPLSFSFDKGEKEALLLVMESGKSLFATDDGKAIKAARFLKIPFIITPKIIIELFRLQEISFKKARFALIKLETIGRYSPEIISDALISLMEYENDKTNNH